MQQTSHGGDYHFTLISQIMHLLWGGQCIEHMFSVHLRSLTHKYTGMLDKESGFHDMHYSTDSWVFNAGLHQYADLCICSSHPGTIV